MNKITQSRNNTCFSKLFDKPRINLVHILFSKVILNINNFNFCLYILTVALGDKLLDLFLVLSVNILFNISIER